MLFFYLAPPTIQNSGIFHVAPILASTLTVTAEIARRSLVSVGAFQVLQKNSHFDLAWIRPRADRGLSRPTSVFRTTIGVCKFLALREAKTCF